MLQITDMQTCMQLEKVEIMPFEYGVEISFLQFR